MAVALQLHPRLAVRRATMFSPCAEPFRSGGAAALSPGGFAEPFPALYAPIGARLSPGDRTSQYNNDGGQHQTVIATDLSVADLAAHYGQQLDAVGWRLQESDMGSAVAWSTWRLPGAEQWHGLFFVLAGLLPNERWLYFRVATAMPARPPAIPIPPPAQPPSPSVPS